MKGTTTGADILKALLQCTNSMSLDLSTLVSVTTDGAPAMIGKNKGAVALLQKHLEDLGRNEKISKVHCLIHQEALCAKTTNLKECYGHSGESCEYDFVSQTESPTDSPAVTRSRESIW